MDTNFGYEEIVIDVDPDSGFKRRRGQPGTHRPRAAAQKALRNSETAAPDQEIGIALDEPIYVVASAADLSVFEDAGATAAEGLTYTEALERVRDLDEAEPGESDGLQVVGAHEAVVA